MALQFILESEFAARALVQFNVIVSCDSEGGSIGGERMVGNWVVEEVVDFGTGHDEVEGR